MDTVAEVITLDKVADKLIDSMDKIVNQMQNFTYDLLPVVMPILGISVIVGFGIKFFKRLAKG